MPAGLPSTLHNTDMSEGGPSPNFRREKLKRQSSVSAGNGGAVRFANSPGACSEDVENEAQDNFDETAAMLPPANGPPAEVLPANGHSANGSSHIETPKEKVILDKVGTELLFSNNDFS